MARESNTSNKSIKMHQHPKSMNSIEYPIYVANDECPTKTILRYPVSTSTGFSEALNLDAQTQLNSKLDNKL